MGWSTQAIENWLEASYQFELTIDRSAIKDIQNAIDYYNDLESGIGKNLENYLDQNVSLYLNNPFIKFDIKMCVAYLS